MGRTAIAIAAVISCLGLAASAPAAPLSVRDSFRIGSSGTIFCSAQNVATDPALQSMFDAGYSVTCRDAALPVGKMYKLRDAAAAPARLAAIRADKMSCSAPHSSSVADLGQITVIDCKLKDSDVGYRAYELRKGRVFYEAEGLSGYDSAIQLGLRSLVADQPVKGEISIATTGAGDPAAFARVQAGTLDPQRALSEAYRRNNSGDYAQAAELFGNLTQRGGGVVEQAEVLANQALQKSALGRYGEAESLFARAANLAGADPVTARRLRNYRAMHLLNQGLAAQASTELDRPMPPIFADAAVRSLVIDRSTAGRLSAESPGASRLRGQEGLTREDKAQILDGQALQLRGTILRLQGRGPEASAPFNRALDELVAIRGGRIGATIWLRAQIYGELASIAEAGRDQPEAERLHRAAIA